MKYLKYKYELNESVDYTYVSSLIENRDIDAIKEFIKNNDINKEFAVYHGCYHYVILDAIYFNNYEVTKMFIDAGADINVSDCDGISALEYACKVDNIEIIKLLIDSGVNDNENKYKEYLKSKKRKYFNL